MNNVRKRLFAYFAEDHDVFLMESDFQEIERIQREETFKNILKDLKKKPGWVWKQWNIGWVTITQDFDRIGFQVMLDMAIHEPQNRVLFGIEVLFWSIEITFGK